jgi:serine/threonine protein kinase HipA of HipAB toxin-antitoxin module
LARFLKQQESGHSTVESKSRATAYSALADAAMAGEVAGTCAGGEHPKFTTSVRQEAGALRHVLVKFSPGGKDRVVQRWADLLVCEHLATRVLYRAGLTTAVTELLSCGDRVFLEAERFDRTGTRGRTGLVSLAALASEPLGRRDTWTSAAASLTNVGVVTPADAETVRRIAVFGRLIANTDMHFGNLSFRLSFDGPFALAPVYDMLPMFYAPLNAGVLPGTQFEPPLPNAENLDIWNEIAAIAATYWRDVAEHESISAEFSAQARRNSDRVAATRSTR